MKRSKQVTLGLLVVMTGALGVAGAGCAKKVSQTCVNTRGLVVADSYCRSGYAGYRHYYGGRYHKVGQKVSGGSYSQPAGTKAVSVNSPSSRGVLGARGGRGGS